MDTFINIKSQREYIEELFSRNNTLKIIKEHCKGNLYVAGGAISSLFTNRKVNDWDIFFENENDYHSLSSILKPLFTWNGAIIKAETEINDLKPSYGPKIYSNTIEINLVRIITGNIDNIFNSFDFRCCMGAYSIKERIFKFDNNFFIDNCMRKLILNSTNTNLNPLNILKRIDKYKSYGFNIDDLEMLKLSLMLKNFNMCKLKDVISFLKTIDNKPPSVAHFIRSNYSDRMVDIKFNTDEGKQKYQTIMSEEIDINLLLDALSN